MISNESVCSSAEVKNLKFGLLPDGYLVFSGKDSWRHLFFSVIILVSFIEEIVCAHSVDTLWQMAIQLPKLRVAVRPHHVRIPVSRSLAVTTSHLPKVGRRSKCEDWLPLRFIQFKFNWNNLPRVFLFWMPKAVASALPHEKTIQVQNGNGSTENFQVLKRDFRIPIFQNLLRSFKLQMSENHGGRSRTTWSLGFPLQVHCRNFRISRTGKCSGHLGRWWICCLPLVSCVSRLQI